MNVVRLEHPQLAKTGNLRHCESERDSLETGEVTAEEEFATSGRPRQREARLAEAGV